VLEKVANGGKNSFACFGLSYKTNVDDLPESPATEIVKFLSSELEVLRLAVTLKVVEPFVDDLPSELRKAYKVRKVDGDEGLEADGVVMLVDHKQFYEIPASRLAGKVVIDTRGVWRR
jgi:UDP-N-acetyl-D-mannosaminuronic acid dehydrogenase